MSEGGPSDVSVEIESTIVEKTLMTMGRKQSIQERFDTALQEYIHALMAEEQPTSHPCFKNGFGPMMEEATAAIYRAASRHSEADHWAYLRIAATSPEANRFVADHIVPMLQERKATYKIRDWWWMNKSDVCGNAIRLRVRLPAGLRARFAESMMQDLGELGRDARLLLYEPELRLFGGPVGMELAHDHFCADSEFLGAWMRDDVSGAEGRLSEGLSLILLLRMTFACGLDIFECWDVFDRVCHKRSLPHASSPALMPFQQLVRKLISASRDRVFQLFEGWRGQLVTDYCAFLDHFGREVSRSYFEGKLECGVREFLVPVILFHWNRAGYSGLRQFGLSHAVAKEFKHLSRKGRAEKSVELA